MQILNAHAVKRVCRLLSVGEGVGEGRECALDTPVMDMVS